MFYLLDPVGHSLNKSEVMDYFSYSFMLRFSLKFYLSETLDTKFVRN